MTKESALLRLTERQRQLIELRDNQKLTWKAIGLEIGISLGYAQQLHKAAVKDLAKWEATDEKDLYDPAKHLGKWSWKEPQPDQQTPPQAVPAPAPAIPETDHDRARALGYQRMQELAAEDTEQDVQQAASKLTEAIAETQKRKPTVAIATATTQPKVKWVTGVPMAVPRSKTPWTSVTIKA